jgi:photosystem II stability/assembly factor-like uncharacterized protein
MNTKHRSLLSAGFALAVSSAAIAVGPAWEAYGPSPQANGSGVGVNVSGRVTSMAYSPNYDGLGTPALFIGTAGGGVWRTAAMDPNQTPFWFPLTDNLGLAPEVESGAIDVGCLTVDPNHPNVIWVGTGEANYSGDSRYGAGILKSTNGGGTWTLLAAATFGRLSISRIIVDPTDATGNTVFAAGPSSGVWRTMDGGANWADVSDFTWVAGPISDMEYTVSAANAVTIYATVGNPCGGGVNGIYLSTNRGVTWTKATGLPASGTLGRISLTADHTLGANRTMYAAAATPLSGACNGSATLLNVYKSTNSGASWVATNYPGEISAGLAWYALAIGLAPNGDVWVGGLTSFRSVNGGGTWSSMASSPSSGVAPHADQHAWLFAHGYVYNGNDGGIFRYNTPFDSIDDLNSAGLATHQIQGLSLHPTDPNIALEGSQDNGTARRDAFNGNEWLTVFGGDGGIVIFDPNDPSIAYQSMPQASSSNFFNRSNDGGNTWTAKVNTISADTFPFYPAMDLDRSNTSRLVIGSSRVYETKDRADTWAAISGQLDVDPLPAATVHNITSLAYAPSNDNTIYAAYDNGRVYRTTNDGVSWAEVDAGRPWGGSSITKLIVNPFNANEAYLTVNTFTLGRLYRTLDGGTNWQDISGNLPLIPANSVALDPRTNPATVFVGMDLGVWRTTNHFGGSWDRFGYGLPNAQVQDLQINLTTGLLGAGTHGRSVFIHPVGDIYVNGGYGGPQNGTPGFPFKTVAAGVNAVAYPQEVVRILAGKYYEPGRISKPCRLSNWNNTGLARVGAN